MPLVAIVTVLACVQYIWFGLKVGAARAKYGIHAPATTGHDLFERAYRVHMNTLEQLVVFLPLLWIFAAYISPLWAAGLGVVYLIGRFVYAATYLRDPKTRSAGFGITFLPMALMMLGILIWAVRAIINGAAF